MLAQNSWQGRWIAPDLRGHGASSHASDYSLQAHAQDIAELVMNGGPWQQLLLLGHSMGGAIAFAVASGAFGLIPTRIFALGLKVSWSDQERAGLAKVATSRPRLFDRREDAAAQYLKVAGLVGLFDVNSPQAIAGVVQEAGAWRLAWDPATASIGPPPMEQLSVLSKSPLHLACGNSDPMVRCSQLATYDGDAVEFEGGHNLMLTNPCAVWDWVYENLDHG
jgi:pimeloyl-ACP methyl ester carboxylesterase